MRTVAELIRELQQFPPDALCWVYDQEEGGIVIQNPDPKNYTGDGFIPCSEDDDSAKTTEPFEADEAKKESNHG